MQRQFTQEKGHVEVLWSKNSVDKEDLEHAEELHTAADTSRSLRPFHLNCFSFIIQNCRRKLFSRLDALKYELTCQSPQPAIFVTKSVDGLIRASRILGETNENYAPHNHADTKQQGYRIAITSTAVSVIHYSH